MGNSQLICTLNSVTNSYIRKNCNYYVIQRTDLCILTFLLTVYLSIFIAVFNQLDAQNLFHNKFFFMPHTYRYDVTRGGVIQF